jgi:hypothetical protein
MVAVPTQKLFVVQQHGQIKASKKRAQMEYGIAILARLAEYSERFPLLALV